MKLALRELRRRPGRFVGAGLILFLLGSLLLLLNGLVEGLNANTDGIIRSQNAQLVVFDGLWHAYWNEWTLPESQEAHHLMADFFNQQLGK